MSAGELRPGWRKVKFGDVVRQVKDKVDPETAGIGRYVAGEHMDTDDLRIRRWGEVGDGYLGPAFTMRFKPGQVLYGSRRTYLRKVALADFEGICANTTFVVESATDDLLPEFLPCVMTAEAFHEHSIKQSKGSVNPYINFSDLKWYEFTLPPLDEQKRIVELAGSIDECVVQYETVDRAAEAVYRALLHSMDDGRYPTKRLADVVEFARAGGTPSRSEPDYYDGGIPWLKSGEVAKDVISETEETISKRGLQESSAWLVPSETIVVAMYGATAGTVGWLAAQMATNQAVLAVRGMPEQVFTRFLFHVLKGDADEMKRRAVGAAQPNLSKSRVLEQIVPIPDLVTQARLAHQLDALMDLAQKARGQALAAGRIPISLDAAAEVDG